MINAKNVFLRGFVGFWLAGATAVYGAETPEAAMKEVAASLGGSLSGLGLKKLAVAEFADLNGYRSALGPFLAEELTTHLFETKPGAFDFVERQQLVKVLEELKLTSSSLFEAGGIASVGKALGIQAVVTGSMADLGNEIKINIRVISVESARIVASASAKFPREESAETLLRQTGGATLRGSGLPGKPAQTSDVYFRNDLVQLTVDSISFSNSRESINLALALENLTDQDLNLHLVCSETSLTSSHGNKYICRNVQGINGEKYYFPWTAFGPRSRSILSFSFDASKNSAADYYSFSTVFARPGKEAPVHFSAGISGIRLQDRTMSTEKPDSRR